MNPINSSQPVATTKPVALVTGSNKGIGLALCKILLNRDYEVIATCREASSELKKLAENVACLIESNIDVCNEQSLAILSAKLQGKSIKILINNAGIFRDDTFPKIQFEDILKQFEVNALGPLKVISQLDSLLTSGSKVINISSRCGSMHMTRTNPALSTGTDIGYHMSKAAQNMMGTAISNKYKPRNIAVANVHPGYVKTDMNKTPDGELEGVLSPDESAEGIFRVIENLRLENTGLFWNSTMNPPEQLLD